MYSYIFILRLTPIFPGWFLNIAAPHVGIPLHIFAISTFVGVLPTTIIYSKAGETLAKLSSGNNVELFNVSNLIILVIIGVLAVVPQFVNKGKSKQL